jgi:hypothetical protein
MHMINVAGLHLEDSSEPAMSNLHEDTDVESRRRIVSVAQHLNTWMSFDMGLACVTLPNLPVPVPSVREGDCTRELVELLPFTMELDPARKPTAADLEHALFTVLDREHTVPPSTLAQCNLALCLCRRLRSMEASLTEPVLQQIVTLTSKGIKAARELLMSRAPWHQMTFVPFQIVCVLLAIDTVSSMSQLRDAMQCIKDISEVYNTPATQEALMAARSLMLLHQRGKEIFASALGGILNPFLLDNSGNDPERQQVPQHLLEGPVTVFPWNLGLNGFPRSDFFWNVGVNWM